MVVLCKLHNYTDGRRYLVTLDEKVWRLTIAYRFRYHLETHDKHKSTLSARYATSVRRQ